MRALMFHQVSIGIDIANEQDALASMLTGIAESRVPGISHLKKLEQDAGKQGLNFDSSGFEFHGVKIKNYRWFLRWFGPRCI